MGEDLLLSGEVQREDSTSWVTLSDGQRLRLPQSTNLPNGYPITLVITTPARYQQNKQELAHHLLAEILNGS